MACIQHDRIYTLTNCKGGTVLDLSGADNYSIIGYRNHNGPNQSWIFQKDDSSDNTWYIKSVGSGQYLGIEGHIDNIRDGTKVVAVDSPFRWHVEDSDIDGVQGIRILAHHTVFSVDLSNHGDSAEGTRVELWGRWNGPNQIWAVRQHN